MIERPRTGGAGHRCGDRARAPASSRCRSTSPRCWQRPPPTARTGSPVTEVDAAVAFDAPGTMTGITDAVSGGTFASLVEMLRNGRGRLPDPHALEPERSRRAGGCDLRPRRHAGTGAWLAPLFPSPLINPPVLHRSAALLRDDGDALFAADYRYREGTVTASMLGPVNVPGVAPVASAAMALGQATVAGAQLLPQGDPFGSRRRAVPPRPGSRAPARARDPRRVVYRNDVHAVTASGDTADVSSRRSVIRATNRRPCSSARPPSPSPPWRRHGPAHQTPATVLGIADLRAVYPRRRPAHHPRSCSAGPR